MAFLSKKYTLASSDNFDAYLKAIGVPEQRWAAVSAAIITQELTESGGEYNLNINSEKRNQVLKFRLGQEIDVETVDGRKAKSTFNLEGNTLIQHQKGDFDVIITRVYNPNDMTQTMKVGGVTCTRHFKA